MNSTKLSQQLNESHNIATKAFIVHSTTYLLSKPENIIHKIRLKRLFSLFKSLNLSSNGSWADFGCSDGFILELIRTQIAPSDWQLYGYDYSEELIDLAQKRNIKKTLFRKFNLNKVSISPAKLYDVVTCFETLEHVGNYRIAIDNLVNHMKSNGVLILSFPNEIGLPGLIKYFGRIILRKNPYNGFFNVVNTSKKYLRFLLSGEDIEFFRDPHIMAWPFHLGFNYKNVMHHIQQEYLQKDILVLTQHRSSFFGFNKIYVFHKKH